MSIPSKVISGGQTGVDQAGLDAARVLGLPIGGWIPNGRLTEAGPLPETYPLVETPSAEYAERTEWNVRDSDATLIVTRGTPTGGTKFTVECAQKHGKPVFVIDLDSEVSDDGVAEFLDTHKPAILNIAGPRESTIPGIYRDAREVLEHIFKGVIR